MKILLTGKNGQVGWELERALAPLGEVSAFGRDALDLSDPGQIVSRVRDLKPDVIVNAGAYTAVDKAESEPALAFAVNAKAPAILAEEAKRIGALLVHYSTDYVFDGTKQGEYVEDDAPNPLSVYGKSKLAGEQAIVASGARHLILRTSWVYGARGKNFLLTMLHLAREKPELRVVDDQIGAPTWCRMIAELTERLLARPASLEAAELFHVAAAGNTTWHGFAAAILGGAGLTNRLLAINTAEFGAAAPRPRNSSLDCRKLWRLLGMQFPDWQVSLNLVLQEIRLQKR